jgi:hypothetical protein
MPPAKPGRTRKAQIKVTSEQYRIIEQRAERCKMSLSAWARAILLQAATRPAQDGHLRIKEPDGALT